MPYQGTDLRSVVMNVSYVNQLRQRLQRLTDVPAPSGYEDALIRLICGELPDSVHEVKVDPLGNVIVRLHPSAEPDPYKVLVFAHMDEVGFIVRNIEDNGFVRIERLGGIPEKSMLGQAVVLDTAGGRLQGVIGTKSHHWTAPEEKFTVPPIREAYVDFGFYTKREAREAGVEVGLPVSYARQFFGHRNVVFSNSLDNRAGCLVLLELIDRLAGKASSSDIFIVFSVQEEFNLHGVLPAVREVNPHVAIALDLAVAADTPDLQGMSDVRLGGGPCLNLYSFHGRGTLAGLIPNPKLSRLIAEVAGTHGIPLQRSTFMGGLTDASFSQFEHRGIPMVDLAFPLRYTHAPLEAVDLEDVHCLIRLVEALLPWLHTELDLKRG